MLVPGTDVRNGQEAHSGTPHTTFMTGECYFMAREIPEAK